MDFEDGDRLLLYTDGITEAHNAQNELYENDRLTEIFEKIADNEGDTALNKINEDVNAFATSQEQFDDMTMMFITIKQNEK